LWELRQGIACGKPGWVNPAQLITRKFFLRHDVPSRLYNASVGRFFLVVLAFLFVLCCRQAPLGAEDAGSGNAIQNGGAFPLITRLDSRDDCFKQFIADVEANRKRVFTRGKIIRDDNRNQAIIDSLAVYQYVSREGDDFFSLAARCNLPYSTLASLNRINHPSMLTSGKPLLLPTAPGIFVPEEPQSDLENLLAASRSFSAEGDSALRLNGTAFYFIPGDEFSATERAFFLNTGFRFPLRSYRLTSGFGMRKNPVTGNMRQHQGVDLAAPPGTEVYAAGDGVVAEIGADAIYGNYIIIRHGGSWVSLYGHLQKIGTSLNAAVKSGTLIGWVGSTGQSTGPHLHFELQQNGKARDPDKYLFLPGGS
jgi:murein DD-endopeptidase MepM/ murein hydrolase activator NlpD